MGVITLLIASLIASAGPSQPAFDERRQLNVDRAALESQRVAIQKIDALAKRYRGRPQENPLLLQLAEAHNYAAGLEFRIAHGAANGEPNPAALKNQKAHLRQVVDTVSRLLKGAPEDEVAGALLLRAKSYDELGLEAHAVTDFSQVTVRFPNSTEALSSHMSLAGYAMKATAYPKAITHLEAVESHPESGYYPHALYKLAWSHYNGRQFERSIGYLEKHIRYYDAKHELEHGLTEGDLAVRDSSLSDLALFLGDAHESDQASFPIDQAYTRMRAIEEGPAFGNMLLKFTRVLRTHGIRDSLLAWQALTLDREHARPEAFEVLKTVAEFFHQRRDYKTLGLVMEAYLVLHKKAPTALPLRSQAATYIASVAEDLQRVILKNQQSREVSAMSATLAVAYSSMTQMLPEEDPRVPGAHFNLAETLFALGRFDDATVHYSWILDHWRATWKGTKLSKGDVALKRVNSRYQAFRLKELTEPLKVTALDSSQSDELIAREQDWIGWVDDLPVIEATADFRFEAARLLYLRRRISPAVERLRTFATQSPDHAKATAAAALVLDTLARGEEWKPLHETATQFRKLKFSDTGFQSRLVRMGGDAYIKAIESAYAKSDDGLVQSDATRFLELYPTDPRREQAILLAAKSAERVQNLARLEVWLSKQLEWFPSTTHAGASFQKRARLFQDRFEFAKARSDLTRVIALHKQKKIDLEQSVVVSLRESTLLLAWLAGDYAELNALTTDEFCVSIEASCDQYQALAALYAREPGLKQADLFQRAKQGPDLNRPIWALAALNHGSQLKLAERADLVRIAASRSGKLDSMVRYVLMPKLTEILPQALAASRDEIQRSGLKPTEQSIMRRIEKIRLIENATTRIMDLPWARVRAVGLDTLASLYGDFTKELGALPVPELPQAEQTAYKEMIEKVVLPFEEKGQELRRKAFEVAAENAIEDDSYQQISKSFFEDNPSQAKVMGRGFQADPVKLDLVTLSDQLAPPISDPKAKLASELWRKALATKAWPLVAYFGQLARDWKSEDARAAGLLSSASLWAAGARAEALAELASLDLEPEPKTRLMVVILRLHQQTLAKKQLKNLAINLLATYEKVSEKGSQGERKGSGRFGLLRFIHNNEEAFAVTYAAALAGIALPGQAQFELLRDAQGSSRPEQAAWASAEWDARKDREPAAAKPVAQKKKGRPKAAPSHNR